MQAPKFYQDLMQELLNWTKDNCPKQEVPISAMVLDEKNQELARAFNLRTTTNNPVGHAEILALTEAAKVKNNWRLDDCTLLVTVEPCAMCAGALLQSRISKLVFGAFEPKTGAVISTAQFLRESKPPIEVISGVLKNECSELITNWFLENQR